MKTILSILLVSIIGYSESSESASTVLDGCKCYANGKSYSPGTEMCLGGNKTKCVAKKGVGDDAKDCGWDNLTDKKGNYIKCGK